MKHHHHPHHYQQQQQQQQLKQQQREPEGRRRQQQQRPWSEKMIDLHIYLVPSEMWRDKFNNMDNEDVSESISLGFIRIHPESRVYDLREEIEIQLNSPNLPQEYVFLKSVGRCLTKVKQHQELRLKAKHFLPQLNSSLKYGNEVYIIETATRGSDSSTSSILMSSDQRNSSNNNHVTGGKFRYQNGNSKPGNGTNYYLPFLQTSEKLKRLVRVGPPHQNLKHINPNPFDPPSNSNSDTFLDSPTYQLGPKLVDDTNYYLEEVAMGTKLHTPPSLSLSPTNRNMRRRRRRLHQHRIPARSEPRSDPVSRNVAGNDDDDDDDDDNDGNDDDDDDDDDVMLALHSYSEPPYYSNTHFRSPFIHSYPYLIDDMRMMPPRYSKRRARNNNNNNNRNNRNNSNNNNSNNNNSNSNNNNNNNDNNEDDDGNNSNDNGDNRQSRSPNTRASLPVDPSQHSTRRSKEKPKAESIAATTPRNTRTMTDGKEEKDGVRQDPADEKRLRELRAREELKRELEEQERWERLDSEEQNEELGLIKGVQEELQQQDGGSDGEGADEGQHKERLSPRKKDKAETGEGKEPHGEQGEEEGEDEDNEKEEEGEEKAEEVKGEEADERVGDEEEEEGAKSVEHNTETESRQENSSRLEPNTEAVSKKGQTFTPSQKPAEPDTARSRQKNESEKLQETLESIREQRKSKERQREDLVKRAKSLQAKIQNRRNHARDIWKKRYYEEKKRTPPLEEQCNKFRHELDVIHRKYISSLEPAKEKPTKITTKKPSEKNNILIQASRMKHETEDLQHRVDNAKMKLTAELKLRNQTEIELKALKGELIQQKINLNLIRKQQLSNAMIQGVSPAASQDVIIALKQPIIQSTK